MQHLGTMVQVQTSQTPNYLRMHKMYPTMLCPILPQRSRRQLTENFPVPSSSMMVSSEISIAFVSETSTNQLLHPFITPLQCQIGMTKPVF